LLNIYVEGPLIHKLVRSHRQTHTGPVALPGPLKWLVWRLTRGQHWD